MSEVTLNFSREEYAERLAKTRAAMARAGIELLIVSDPSNMAWLTGYDGWSFYVHQCVLVPPDGDPIWYGRGQDAAGARLTSYLDHDRIIGYPDHYVQSSDRHPMDFLARVLGERGWDKCATGVEMDNYWYSAAAHAALVAHLPGAGFRDATGLVIAHIAGWTEVVRRDATGNEYTELAPMIETDLILRIIPPPGDEILR